MDVNIVDKSKWERVLEVHVSTEELAPDIEKAYIEYKKNIKLEGFRKGKVPINLIKRIFGKEIASKVAENKIPDIITNITKEKKLKPFAPAKLEKFSYDMDWGLKFTALMEVMPDIEIQNYKGLSLEKEVYQVQDEDVDDALEELREQNAIMMDVDKEAQLGHYIIADVQKVDETGVPVIGHKWENRYIPLTENSSEFEHKLTEQLLGVKVGEIRQVKLASTNSQSQLVYDTYLVTIKEIKEKKLPDLDDEFAKDVGDFENLEDLKLRLRKDLDYNFKREYDQLFTEKIIDELVKSNSFELPDSLISNYLDLLIKRIKKDSKEKIDEDQLREKYRSNAIHNLKWMMIRDKIFELEEINVADSEIDEYIELLANANKKDSIKIKSFYRTKENREKLEDELLDQKVIQFLINQASINEIIVTRKETKKEPRIIV